MIVMNGISVLPWNAQGENQFFWVDSWYSGVGNAGHLLCSFLLQAAHQYKNKLSFTYEKYGAFNEETIYTAPWQSPLWKKRLLSRELESRLGFCAIHPKISTNLWKKHMHQLIPIIYRVLAPSQVVGNGISSCSIKYRFPIVGGWTNPSEKKINLDPFPKEWT